ncbi:unnamed protein product [Prunus brigantina]
MTFKYLEIATKSQMVVRIWFSPPLQETIVNPYQPYSNQLNCRGPQQSCHNRPNDQQPSVHLQYLILQF